MLILWQFYSRKKPDDYNNKAFSVLVIITLMNALFEMLSICFVSAKINAIISLTTFYVFQVLLSFAIVCYIRTLRENKIISIT